jgi:Bacteriophage HK97-gp10, putative tail-component
MRLRTLLVIASIIGLFRLSSYELFNIEWEGLGELEEFFRKAPERFEKILLEELTKFGLLVEEGTKALAPKDTGDLEASINFGPAKKEGQTFVVDGGTNLKYAIKVHERPGRTGSFPKYDDGAKFPNYYEGGLGRRTRLKPNWRGERPGRKYMQRAINLSEEDWELMMARVYERLMAGDY